MEPTRKLRLPSEPPREIDPQDPHDPALDESYLDPRDIFGDDAYPDYEPDGEDE